MTHYNLSNRTSHYLSVKKLTLVWVERLAISRPPHSIAAWVVLLSLLAVGNTSLSGLAAEPAAVPSAPTSAPTSGQPPSNPAPAAGTEASASVDEGYTLGRGDRVRLDIFNVPEYGGEYLVLSDGTLSLPLIGSVPVRGMTLKQASKAIADKYGESILRDPLVTVILLSVRPIKIAIAGEVNRPGAYTLSAAEKDAGAPTVTSAIQLAGGITPSADIRKIQVRRLLPSQQGGEQVMTVNLWELLQTAELSQDVALRDGDTIVIPQAPPMTPEEATRLASASFSPDKIRVNVVGEVKQPGGVEVPPNTPLNQALLAAGGFNTRARKRSVELIRLNPNGTVTRQSISIDLAQGLNDKTNPALRNNDTIVVGKSTFAGATDALGTLLSPVTGVFSFIRLLGL